MVVKVAAEAGVGVNEAAALDAPILRVVDQSIVPGNEGRVLGDGGGEDPPESGKDGDRAGLSDRAFAGGNRDGLFGKCDLPGQAPA